MIKGGGGEVGIEGLDLPKLFASADTQNDNCQSFVIYSYIFYAQGEKHVICSNLVINTPLQCSILIILRGLGGGLYDSLVDDAWCCSLRTC